MQVAADPAPGIGASQTRFALDDALTRASSPWWCSTGTARDDAGGTREIVADGVHGLLLPVPDDAGLGAGIVRLARDPALRQRLGGAARDRAATDFSIERFVGETAALYEEMVARRARARGRLA